MKNAIKTIWLIVGLLFVSGMVLAVIGIGLGAARRIEWTENGLHAGSTEVVSVQKSDNNVPAFRKVDLNLPATRTSITVRESDHYGYDIKLPSARRYELDVTVADGVLQVSPRGNWSGPGFSTGVFDLTQGWMGINLDFGNPYGTSGEVVVYVPQGTQLDAVALNLAAGKYDIAGINAKDLRINCPAGDVTIADIVADTVDLSITTGSMRASNITTDSFTGKLTAGELTSTETSAAVVNLSCTTGQLRYSGDASKALTIDVTMGEGTVDLRRPRSAYALTTDVTAGDLSINGRSTGRIRESDPNLIPLRASVATGQISLSFGM
ncbi:MAG: DUF4097 domain-containing protein [Actinomycetia bacterium]|nr:DUF4097 domain-containing protein [Actinomycetes bacterium]